MLCIGNVKAKYIVPKCMHIVQNTDENKKAYTTELTNSGVYDKLNNHKDATLIDNYDILRNMLSGIDAKCMPTKKLK